MVEESYFDDLDLKFLNLSARFSDFFSWTYGMLGCRLIAPLDPKKFDNATTKVKEVAIRALIVLGTVMSLAFAGTFICLTAVVLGVGSKIFRSVGFALQKNNFTHVRGHAKEKALQDGQANVMTWNIRGHGGGLYYIGGVIHWRSRVDQIVEQIKKEDPDVIVLQETYDAALISELIDRLKGEYAHFYTHLGANTWGQESGVLVITKCAVHQFTHTDFAESDSDIKRGFATIEIKGSSDDEFPCARIIGTQLSSGKEGKEKRMGQIAQVIDTLSKETVALPTFFVGNLNFDRNHPEEGAYLSQYLYHSYRDKDPTHSDELVKQWAPIYEGQEESSDYISIFKRNIPNSKVLPVIEKNIRMLDCHLSPGFDKDYSTKTARSDHHAVVTRFSGLKEVKAGA